MKLRVGRVLLDVGRCEAAGFGHSWIFHNVRSAYVRIFGYDIGIDWGVR